MVCSQQAAASAQAVRGYRIPTPAAWLSSPHQAGACCVRHSHQPQSPESKTCACTSYGDQTMVSSRTAAVSHVIMACPNKHVVRVPCRRKVLLGGASSIHACRRWVGEVLEQEDGSKKSDHPQAVAAAVYAGCGRRAWVYMNVKKALQTSSS